MYTIFSGKAILPGNNPASLPIPPMSHQRISIGTHEIITSSDENDNLTRLTQDTQITEREDDNHENENSSFEKSPLCQQFESLNNAVTIPDNSHKQVLDVCQMLRKSLRRYIPCLQTIIFRNWYLKLKNSSVSEQINEPLQIYVYAEDTIPGGESPDNFCWLRGRLLQPLMAKSRGRFSCTE
ncbi:MAG: hypothetical protein V4547_18395 [Bacteroidota bacterium]